MTVQDRLVPGRYRLRVEDLELLSSAGVFGDARTELIEGEVIVLSPQYRPHMVTKDELAFAIRLALRDIGSVAQVGTEGSVALSAHDMPQPDIVITTAARGHGPIPLASVMLVVEVSDTTLATDLDGKARLYAATGIPEYWVADVNGRVIHQLWNPGEGGYGERCDTAFGAPMVARTIAGLTISTIAL